MTLISFVIYNRDILSPTVIAYSMFCLSTLIAVLMAKEWELVLSPITVITIFIGLFFFGLGEFTVRWALNRKYGAIKIPFETNNSNTNNKELLILFRYTFLISIGMLAFLIVYFKKIYAISLLGGNEFGYHGMLEYSRTVMLQQGVTPGTLLNQIFKVCKAIAYVYLFAILYNKIYLNIKKLRISYYIPIILFLITALLSTSRTHFTQFTVYALIVGFILYYKKYAHISIRNKKIIKAGITGVILFLTLFSILGYSTGRTQSFGALYGVAYYIGGSIPALDNYLNNPPSESGYFGSETLYIYYNSLNSYLNFDAPSFRVNLETINGSNIASNVYTAFRRYIQDYGYIGMCIIVYILGVIYSIAYQSIKLKNKVGFSLIMYAYFFYPIVEFVIEERFFIDIISISTIIEIISMYGFYNLLVRKSCEKNISTKKLNKDFHNYNKMHCTLIQR
ncbi:O-antigen polymerase [Schinkia azotoformans]|nr:O-antigen polymerase [Schinkia azotoformans]MEC1771909.1 O-antigen ligase [Schinkia azotoformans]MED4366407.1 O-antigen ligase [Schinkia azotoformans]